MRKLLVVLFVCSAMLCLLSIPLSAQISWQKYSGNPVVVGACAQINAPCVIFDADAGIYKMWYSCATPDIIRYATSPDGFVWSNDQLVNGIPDYGYSPCVLKISGVYHMWYGKLGYFYHATSADGVNWTPSGPSYYYVGPSVLYDGGSFKGWFSHAGAIYYSTSADGVNWGTFTQVLSAPPGWEETNDPCVLPTASGYEMWFTLRPTPYNSLYIGYATSSDGVNWSIWPSPVLGPGPAAWDSKYVLAPTILKEGSVYRMWYTGSDETTDNGEGIGLATSRPQPCIVDSIPSPPSSLDILGATFDGTDLWVSCAAQDSVYRVDSSDGTVLGRFRMHLPDARGLAAQWDSGVLYLWTFDYPCGSLVKINAAQAIASGSSAGAVSKSCPISGCYRHALAFDGTRLWVDRSDQGSSVYEINAVDPVNCTMVASIVKAPDFGFGHGLAAEGGYIWYLGNAPGVPEPRRLVQIQISTGRAVSDFIVPFVGQLAAENERYLWVVPSSGGWMYKVDLLCGTGPVSASVDFDPNTLNLKSKGRWVTCYIELPEGHDVADINVGSVMLNGSVPAETRPVAIGDYDGDGIADLMVKFDRSEVGAVVTPGRQVAVTVTGNVGDEQFSGTDYVNVINPPVSPPNGQDPIASAKTVSLEVEPNPFNPSVRIQYAVPAQARVLVQVLSVTGQLIRTLEDAQRPTGMYAVTWDGRNEGGENVASGLYICRLTVGSEVVTKKLTLLK